MSRTATKTGTAVATTEAATVRPIDRFKNELTLRQGMLTPLLPAHVPFDLFKAIVISAVGSNPKLLECPMPSLIKASIEAAELGLSLNPSLGEGDILPVWKGQGPEAQFRPRYMGLMKLARQSGEISDIYAHEVREGDHFYYEYGLEKKLEHRPGEKRGAITHAYVVWILKDGGKGFEVLDRAKLDDARDRSEGWKAFKAGKIKSTPWHTDEGEMCRKTAVRRGSKYMPRSAEAFQRAVALDNLRDAGIEANVIDGEVIADAEDITTPPAQKPPQAAEKQVDNLEQRMASPQQPAAQPVKVIPIPEVADGPDYKGWADACVAHLTGIPAGERAAWLKANSAAVNAAEFNAADDAARVRKAAA